MVTKRIFGLFIFILFSNQIYSTSFFYAQYLRLGYGFCKKCITPLKLYNNIKDEYKPNILFSEKEINTYKSDLIFAGISDWPSNKLVFSDSLCSKFEQIDFPILYLIDDKKNIQNSIKLDLNLDYNIFNVIYSNIHEEAILKLDSNIVLGRGTSFSGNSKIQTLNNPLTKSLYIFRSKKAPLMISLNYRLKYKILSNYYSDTSWLKESIESIEKNNVDDSEFGSVFLNGDTLITVLKIAKLTRKGGKNYLDGDLFICTFLEGVIIDAVKIRRTREHIIFDEYGRNGIFYKEGFVYLRSNNYDFKDKMKRKNHISVLYKVGDYFVVKKKLNLEIPKSILNKTNSNNMMIDYTAGGFIYNKSAPDYFYHNAASIFIGNHNIAISDSSILNQGDSIYIHSATYKHDFLMLLVTFPKLKELKLLLLNRKGEILLSKKVPLSISNDCFYHITENGLFYLNSNLKTLNFVKITTSDFINSR